MSRFKVKNRQDIKAEIITGVVFDFGDGVTFKTRRAGGANAKYTAALQVVNQKLMRVYGSRPVPPDVRKDEQIRLYANTCLLDWTMKSSDGASVPFTPEAAIEFLIDPEHDIYYGELDARISDPRSFLVEDDGTESVEQIASALGNSSAGS